LYVYFKEGIKLIKNYLSLFIVATQVFMLTSANAQPENKEQRVQEKAQLREEKTEAKAQRVTASCDKVSTNISKRLTHLQESLNRSTQAIANIEASVQTKIETLKSAGKDTTLIETNFSMFKTDADQILAEKQVLINQLTSLSGTDCQSDKKTFATSLKNFNNSLRTHTQNYVNLKSFLRTNVVNEIKKLNESAIN
jgi:hypothetical protein